MPRRAQVKGPKFNKEVLDIRSLFAFPGVIPLVISKYACTCIYMVGVASRLQAKGKVATVME